MADDRRNATRRSKDGRDWRIGSAEEVRWIEETPRGKSVADAIPPIFEAYATLEQPLTGDRMTEWEVTQDRQLWSSTLGSDTRPPCSRSSSGGRNRNRGGSAT